MSNLDTLALQDDVVSLAVASPTMRVEDEFEELLNEWKSKLFVQFWLQEHSMYFYNKLNNFLTYPVIIISSVSSATLFTTSNPAVKYVVGCLTLTTGILTAVARQMRPAELYQQHASTTLRYQALIRTIDTYVSLPKGTRPEDPATFLKKIEMEIAALSENQINAPPYIKKKFEASYGSMDRLIYGEEILELMRNDVERKNYLEKMRNKRKTGSNYISILPTAAK